MNRTPALVEIHYAFWAVLAVPLGFASLFFIFPGLIFREGMILGGAAGFLLFYISRLTRMGKGARGAWLLGVVFHAAVLIAAVYYIPRWPSLLAYPLALANLYSLAVLIANRGLWAGAPRGEAVPV